MWVVEDPRWWFLLNFLSPKSAKEYFSQSARRAQRDFKTGTLVQWFFGVVGFDGP